MTRKDYILIAQALSAACSALNQEGHVSGLRGVRYAALQLSNALARDNPRFDRARFLKACGVQS